MAELFNFELKATDGKARTGVINTPRGEIRTPAFMQLQPRLKKMQAKGKNLLPALLRSLHRTGKSLPHG